MSEAIAERLRLDLGQVTEQITGVLRQQVGEVLRRSGLVVAMSGGVDSSVCAALAAAAVGRRRVLGLALPERESDAQSLSLARDRATQLGIAFLVEDMSPILETKATRSNGTRDLTAEDEQSGFDDWDPEASGPGPDTIIGTEPSK